MTMPIPGPPVVLAYGIGVDSTALLLCGESIISFGACGCRRHLVTVENH